MSETDHDRPETEVKLLTQLRNWGSIIQAGKETRRASKSGPLGTSIRDQLRSGDRSVTWEFTENKDSHKTSLQEFYNEPCLTDIWQPTRLPKKPEASKSKRLLEYETEPFAGHYLSLLRGFQRDRNFFRSVEPKWAGHTFDRYTVTMLATNFDRTNFVNPSCYVDWVSVLDRYPDGNYFSWTGYRLTDNNGQTLVLAAVNSEGNKFHNGNAGSQLYLDALQAPWQIPDTPPSEDSAAPADWVFV